MTKTWHKAVFVAAVVIVTLIAINNDPTGILPKLVSFKIFGSSAKKAA